VRTIRGRILFSFLLVSLVGLGVAGFTSYSVSRNALLDAARSEGTALAEKLRDSFQQYISARGSFLETVAGHEEMKSGDWERSRKFLSSLDAKGMDIQAFFFIQPSGDALYLDGRVSKLGDRAYFKDAMSTGKTVISNPLLSRTTNEMVVIVASPVVGADGKPAGVLCGRIVANAFLEIVKVQKWGADGYAFVVDSTGLVAAHPNQELIGTENVMDEKSEKFSAGVRHGLKLAQENKTSVTSFSENGETMMIAFSRVPGTGWLVALIAPEKDFLESVYMVRLVRA